MTDLVLPLLQAVVSNQSVRKEVSMRNPRIGIDCGLQSRQRICGVIDEEVYTLAWRAHKVNEADARIPSAPILIGYF